jgi:hypothetical protein
MVLVDGHEDGKGKAGAVDDGGGTPRACRCVLSKTLRNRFLSTVRFYRIHILLLRAWIKSLFTHLLSLLSSLDLSLFLESSRPM